MFYNEDLLHPVLKKLNWSTERIEELDEYLQEIKRTNHVSKTIFGSENIWFISEYFDKYLNSYQKYESVTSSNEYKSSDFDFNDVECTLAIEDGMVILYCKKWDVLEKGSLMYKIIDEDGKEHHKYARQTIVIGNLFAHSFSQTCTYAPVLDYYHKQGEYSYIIDLQEEYYGQQEALEDEEASFEDTDDYVDQEYWYEGE